MPCWLLGAAAGPTSRLTTENVPRNSQLTDGCLAFQPHRRKTPGTDVMLRWLSPPPSLGGADDLAQRTQPEGAPLTLWPQALASPLRASSPAVKGGSSPPGNPWPKKNTAQITVAEIPWEATVVRALPDKKSHRAPDAGQRKKQNRTSCPALVRA